MGKQKHFNQNYPFCTRQQRTHQILCNALNKRLKTIQKSISQVSDWVHILDMMASNYIFFVGMSLYNVGVKCSVGSWHSYLKKQNCLTHWLLVEQKTELFIPESLNFSPNSVALHRNGWLNWSITSYSTVLRLTWVSFF